jgi:hypothetical protein
MGAHLALGLYLNGINANYTPNFNGLPEIFQDGAAGTASWDGKRNAAVPAQKSDHMRETPSMVEYAQAA